MGSNTLTIQRGAVLDGRFEIIEVLGQGSFATVYKARQVNIDRPVAIKILEIHSDEGDAERFQKRFLMEARSAASLNHPGVVTIFDHGVMEGGVPFIAMELLEGCTLEWALKSEGSMEAPRALPLFVRCLDALQAAHDKNIIHKDLKPSNLFVTNPGTLVEAIKILDFGIAAMAHEEGLTQTDQYAGMAPRFSVEDSLQTRATPAMDLYQMGLVISEALTGQKPIGEEGPILPQGLQGGPLGEFLRRSWSLDAEARFGSAAEMRDALAALDPRNIDRPVNEGDSAEMFFGLDPAETGESERVVEAPEPPLSEPPASKAQVERSPFVYGAGVVLLVGLAAGFYAISTMGDPQPVSPAVSDREAVPSTPSQDPKVDRELPPEPVQDREPSKIDKAQAPVRLTFSVNPASATITVLGQEGLKIEASGGRASLVFEPASAPPPWEVEVSSPRHQSALLRFEPDPTRPTLLKISDGHSDGDRVLWSAGESINANADGGFIAEVALSRVGQARPPNKKNLPKDRWIVD